MFISNDPEQRPSFENFTEAGGGPMFFSNDPEQRPSFENFTEAANDDIALRSSGESQIQTVNADTLEPT